MRRPHALFIVTATAVLLSIILGIAFIVRSGLPSADVVARHAANRPIIKVSDFNPGEVEFVSLNGLGVIIWRRNEADKALAASQNAPEDWRHQYSPVLGKAEPIFADDTNLTLNNEWFFTLTQFPNRTKYLLTRGGDFEGFFEGRYAIHFDLAGRARKGYESTNLTVIEAEYVDDGHGIRLYLDGKP